MPNFLGVMLRHCVGRGDTQTAAQFAEGVVEVEVEVGWVVLSSRQVELERGALTAKPAVAAQVLSPAALIMAALSMWPVPTRLYKSRNVSANHGSFLFAVSMSTFQRISQGDQYSPYLESTYAGG